MNENEERKVGIPESITINGVTYAVKDTPELQKFAQEVAKVEKSKLYTQFENLKSQIANLGKVQIVGGNTDVDEIVEKLKGTFVTKEDFQQMLPGIVKEVVQPVLTATEQNRKDELNAYREKLISENIATCIPDLVRGETKEELDKSLQESIRLRASYPTPSTAAIDPTKHVTDPLIQRQMAEMPVQQPAPQAAPQPTPQPQPSVPQQPTPPIAPSRPAPQASGPTNIKAMPMSEFAKKREQLEQELKAMYGDGQL